MYKNTITSENTPDSHKAVIIDQLDGQLAEAANSETSAEQLQRVKDHFFWLLANDFYKNECSAEQITRWSLIYQLTMQMITKIYLKIIKKN